MSTRLIGIGLGGLAHIEHTYLTGIDGVELIGGVDIAPTARERFESEFDAPAYEHVDALLAALGTDADAAIVVTPHTLHYEQIVACFEADLHVFVEKPMVTGLENAVDVVETAANRELLLQVGYQRHFHPGYQELKRLIDSGRIGDIHMVSCHLGQDWITPQAENDSWRANPGLSGGGQLYDSGSHLLDALLWVTDSTPREVAALMEFREHAVDVNSALTATLDRDGQPLLANISITGDGPASPDTSEGIVIWGTDGRVEYSGGEITVTEKDGVGRQSYTMHVTDGTDFESVFTAKLENFVNAVRGDADLRVPGTVGLKVTALTEAAYKAYESKSVIDVTAEIEAARTAQQIQH